MGVERMKACTKCGLSLPATTEWFYLHGGRSPDGLRPECKNCTHASHRRWRLANLERKREADRLYVQEHHEAHKERCSSYYRRRKANGLIPALNDEQREEGRVRKAKWAAEHPEQVLAQTRNRKARKRGNGGSHTAEDIQDQYERQRGRCFYCDKKVGDDYHVDHVVPLSLGGSNGPENLVVACPGCNLSKSAKHPIDFCGRLL